MPHPQFPVGGDNREKGRQGIHVPLSPSSQTSLSYRFGWFSGSLWEAQCQPPCQVPLTTSMAFTCTRTAGPRHGHGLCAGCPEGLHAEAAGCPAGAGKKGQRGPALKAPRDRRGHSLCAVHLGPGQGRHHPHACLLKNHPRGWPHHLQSVPRDLSHGTKLPAATHMGSPSCHPRDAPPNLPGGRSYGKD